jgi:hypothetical protein
MKTNSGRDRDRRHAHVKQVSWPFGFTCLPGVSAAGNSKRSLTFVFIGFGIGLVLV